MELEVADREYYGADFIENLKDFRYCWIEKEKLAKAKWKGPKKRKEDPRSFLLYPQQEKLKVQATTSKDQIIQTNAVQLQNDRWHLN